MNLFVSSAPLKPSREAKKVKKFADKISGVILSYLRTNIPNFVRQSVSFTFFELAITFGIFILDHAPGYHDGVCYLTLVPKLISTRARGSI